MTTRNEAPSSAREPRRLPRRALLACAVTALVLGTGLLASRCSTTVPLPDQVPLTPPVAPITQQLSTQQRQAAAEAFIRAAGSYAWDSNIAEWKDQLRPLTTTDVTFPLTGPSYARCINDRCSLTVTDVIVEEGSEFTFSVTQELRTETSADAVTSLWQVTVGPEGRVTDFSARGDG